MAGKAGAVTDPRERRIEWAAITVTQGEVLDSFRDYCRDELDDVEVVEHAPSLQWDLGDMDGTVAVRMPLHPVALEILRETGPMAVSSANKTGQPPAGTAEEARAQLSFSVSVYLEVGELPDRTPSSIVDLTGPVPRLLRAGAIPLEKLRDVVPTIEGA